MRARLYKIKYTNTGLWYVMLRAKTIVSEGCEGQSSSDLQEYDCLVGKTQTEENIYLRNNGGRKP